MTATPRPCSPVRGARCPRPGHRRDRLAGLAKLQAVAAAVLAAVLSLAVFT